MSLIQAAAALNANNRWQELIVENLAASSIPGYRKQDLSFAAVQAGLMRPGIGQPSAPASAYLVPQTTTGINFQPGEIKPTGVNTDLAIEGEGFFEVQLADGSAAYTRSGEFQLDAQGQLVTKEGYLVMTQGGPIQLDLNISAPLSVSATGEVSQGADTKGRLKLVNFSNPHLLRPIGGGYFLSDHPQIQMEEATQATVRQGFLEASNISSMKEMANLITAMRAYEVNQRVIQLNDERMSRTINELGNPG